MQHDNDPLASTRMPGERSDNGRRVNVFQGQCETSDDPNVYFSTLLGSCISVCLRDPVARVGGLNHFLVPGDQRKGQLSLSHGVHAMELLINELLKKGAQKRRLEAKLFGGAHVVAGVSDIGQSNTRFAEQFLFDESIPCIAKCVGGDKARRLKFWPVSGRARQLLVPISDAPAIEAPKVEEKPFTDDDLGLF